MITDIIVVLGILTLTCLVMLIFYAIWRAGVKKDLNHGKPSHRGYDKQYTGKR